MLSNCEKMAVISSTINEWPQNQIDEAGMNMGSTGRVMDQKPGGQEHQQPLKCPRCDSSNTKFCYYNNYSLSQPRHFCKACKRYWTRGGTLRNVPVGGGCRKNKRVKRPSSSSSSAAIDSPSSNSLPPPQIDTSSTSNHISPLFYNLPNNPLFNPRVSNVDTVSGYDLQPQLSGLGLGFSSGVDDYRNGINPSCKQIHSNSLFSSYNSMFGSASSTSPTMASLIASTLQQQKFINGGHKESRVVNHFQSLLPFQDMHIGSGMNNKEAKLEEAGQTRLEEWNNNYQTQIEQISHDPSLYWNPSTNAWPDLANLGSSSVL